MAQPPDERHNLILDSINATASLVRSEQYTKQLEHGLKLLGAELAEQVAPDDSTGLCAVAAVELDGAQRQALVLALTDRLVVAWRVGTIRQKYFSSVVPYDSISQVTVYDHAEYEQLKIDAERSWSILFVKQIRDGGPSPAVFLRDVIEGRAKVIYEDPTQKDGPAGAVLKVMTE